MPDPAPSGERIAAVLRWWMASGSCGRTLATTPFNPSVPGWWTPEKDPHPRLRCSHDVGGVRPRDDTEIGSQRLRALAEHRRTGVTAACAASSAAADRGVAESCMDDTKILLVARRGGRVHDDECAQDNEPHDASDDPPPRRAHAAQNARSHAIGRAHSGSYAF